MCYNARKKGAKAKRGGVSPKFQQTPSMSPIRGRAKRARVEGKGAGGRGASGPLDTYPNITK